MKVEMQQLEYFTSSLNGFSVKLNAQHKSFDPLQNLPAKGNFKSGPGDALNNFETSVAVRFAYLERFLEGNYFRTSLGSDYPIIELKYSKGWSGGYARTVLKDARLTDRLWVQIATYGPSQPWTDGFSVKRLTVC